MGDRTCWIENCDRAGWYSGKCWEHRGHVKENHRLSRRRRGATVAERLAVYGLADDSGCIIWTGNVNSSGYGTVRVNGRTLRAHRVAWEIANGPIPPGMQIDHICHNRRCVNVAHLRLATHAQNQRNRDGAPPTSSTGVRNVHRNGRGYRVSLKKNNVRHDFGAYSTIEAATPVAAVARADLFGAFAGRG